jgi:hypothetical protein
MLESFADCIGGLLSIVAQNLTLTIEPLNNTKINGLETKYSYTQKDGVYDVKLGDLYSEESRNIICNVLIPKQDHQYESQEVSIPSLLEQPSSCFIAYYGVTGGQIYSELFQRDNIKFC